MNHNMTAWVEALNAAVLAEWHTRLRGGYAEPLYLAPVHGRPAEIRFTHDYERSALHELAHWCVAGADRRQLDDYGYWYAPDGRNNAQQREFFRVEIRPQAIERHLCDALGISFDVSVDNLDNNRVDGITRFRHDVEREYRRLQADSLPARADRIHRFLARQRGGT